MGSKIELLLRQLLKSGIESVLPQNIFKTGRKIISVNNGEIEIFSSQYALPIASISNLENKKVHVVGFGKAVYGLAVALESVLHVESGMISVPIENRNSVKLNKIKVFEGAKDNLPDLAALESAKKIKAYAESLKSDDILFVLISGGGSALLPLPISNLTLEEKLEIIKRLARNGAAIDELNYVRIALSDIKGGKLAQSAKYSHQVVSLIISDIIGDPVELIASGPTIIPKENIAEKAKEILQKFNLWNDLKNSLKKEIEETKPIKEHSNGVYTVIANNKIAIQAAMDEALKHNITPIFLSDSISGDVNNVSHFYFKLSKFVKNFIENSYLDKEEIENDLKERNIDPEKLYSDLIAFQADPTQGICLISGGETTVNVRGSGLGGRNQQMVLSFMAKCQSNGLRDVYLLSAGTDGIDGPTNAAGAIGSLDILESQFPEKRFQIDQFLNENNSYEFFSKQPCHIVIGHTGTNVMDLQILFIHKSCKISKSML